jgi:hypothetical protein
MHGMATPAAWYCGWSALRSAAGAKDSGRNFAGAPSRAIAMSHAARRGRPAWKCGETPTSMLLSGDVDLSSRPMKWNPAVDDDTLGPGGGLPAEDQRKDSQHPSRVAAHHNSSESSTSTER